ncbi:hypothetical protein JCM16138_14370 [Thermococcus atlanticus]
MRIKLLMLVILVIGLGIGINIVKAETTNPSWEYNIGKPIRSVDISQDGGYVVAGTEYPDGTVYYFKNGKLLWEYNTPSSVYGLAISADGKYIVAGGSDVLLLSDLGQLIWRYDVTTTVRSVDITPDGKYVVAGAINGLYLLSNKGKLLWYKPIENINSVAISPDGKYIVVGSTRRDGGYLYLISDNGTELWVKKITDYLILSVDISDNYYIAGGCSDGNVIIINKAGDFVSKYRVGTVRGVAFSRAGKFLAIRVDDRVMLIDALNKKVIWERMLPGGISSPGKGVAITPDASFLVTGTRDGELKVIYLEDELDKAFLNVNSIPVGAKVYINDEYKGKTPTTLQLSPGTYTVKLIKNDYENYTTTVTIGMGEIKNVSVTLVPLFGYLSITSNPSGAEVYIDGSYIGTTPINDYKLSTGQHEVKLAKEGYHEYLKIVTIQPSETTGLNAELSMIKGTLKISSIPSRAKVYIDGSYAGETPLDYYNVSPGEHTIRVEKEGYEVFTRTVTVNPGQTASITASLVVMQTSGTTTTARSTATIYSETTTFQTYTHTEQPSPTSAGTTEIKTLYIIGALLGLVLLGGVAAKARGGKFGGRPGDSEVKPIENPEQVKKAKAESKKRETKKPKTEKPSLPVPGFPPALLPRYEPIEFLGEGGFAKVFKVRRKKDGKIVALKVPRIDERTSKTFIKEVSSWLHLNHENIVKLYDVDILPVPYLEMEFVEGAEVDGRLARDLDEYPKPLDEKTALKLIRGIALGLAHAHSKGIYHRDLKPLNVLLKADLTPKITDWGLAKIGTMSSGRSVMGYTPLYAAPEHLMPGKYGHTDARTDIWQLGVTFYELLTGKLPFEGYTYEEVFGKIVDEGYRAAPPSRINPSLAKYDGIFEKLLAKRKEERYQSIDEFLRDLEKLEKVEKRKAELEKEVEELKKSLKMSVEALKKSRTAEETLRNRRLVVETLGKLALAYAELNRKAELLNTLNDLKFYTVQNLGDLTSAISTVELLIRENLSVGGDFIERLKVLVHSIRRENGT